MSVFTEELITLWDYRKWGTGATMEWKQSSTTRCDGVTKTVIKQHRRQQLVRQESGTLTVRAVTVEMAE